MKQRTRPNKCHHEYCLPCIKEWVKHESTCPFCKVPFTQLLVFDPRRPSAVKNRLSVKQRKLKVEDESYFNITNFWDDTCYVC